MPSMSLRQLTVLNAVMRTNTLTEAARLLGISQPAISKAVKEIEARLGMGLFKRIRGRLHPTPEVQVLYGTIEQIFSGINHLDRQTAELRDGTSGHLVLAALPTLAGSIVAEAIGRLRQNRPGVLIEVRELTNDEIVKRLVSQQADLGMVYGPSDDVAIRSRELNVSEIVCVMHKDHPLAARKTITPKQLESESLISYPSDSRIHALLMNAFAQSGAVFQLNMIVNNTLTAYSLVQATSGIALVDSFLFRTRSFPLLVVRPFRPAVVVYPRVLYARHRPISRIASVFIDILREICAQPTPERAPVSRRAR